LWCLAPPASLRIVAGSPFEGRREATRYATKVLFASVADAVLVGIFVGISDAVAITVAFPGVGAEALLAQVADTVTIAILGRIDHPVAVAVAFVGVTCLPLRLERVTEQIAVAVSAECRGADGKHEQGAD
jgi:ABC-type transporter Mla maintaining outer membrane lipid asymmetry permease subunit MlaE